MVPKPHRFIAWHNDPMWVLTDFSTPFAPDVCFLFHKSIKIDKPPVEIFFNKVES
jgi:hypothetical protein